MMRHAVAALLDPRTRAALLVLVVGGLLVAVTAVGVPGPSQVRAVLAAEPVWTPALAVLGIAVLAVLVFPRAGIAVVAGLVFGPWAATGYVMAGTLLGAAVAFGVGRALGREYVASRTSVTGGRLARIDAWLGRRPLLAVVSTRLVPIVPFGLLNYAFGTTRVRLGTFLAGTGIGILPSTVLYATAGSAATDPGSPVFVVSVALAALLALTGLVIAGRTRGRRGTHEVITDIRR
jgi:uncharacterized membrane protein YdjX (TVP38/TMEM64 family)